MRRLIYFKHLLRQKWERASKIFEGRPTEDNNNENIIRRKKILTHNLFHFSFAFSVALVMNQSEPKWLGLYPIRSGEIAEQEIVSPLTFELSQFQDRSLKKEEVEKNIPPVFDYDDLIFDSWYRRWEIAFRTIRKEFYTNKPLKKGVLPEELNQRILTLTDQLLSPNQLFYFHEAKFSESLEQTFLDISRNLSGRLIATAQLMSFYYNTGIHVRLLNQSQREVAIRDLSRVWNLEQTREFLFQLARSQEKPESYLKSLQYISLLVVPNLKFNAIATRQEIDRALIGARLAPLNIRKGQTIIQKGERVTEDHEDIVNKLIEFSSGKNAMKRFIFSFAVLFLLFSFLFRLNIAGRHFWNMTLKDALLFQALTVLVFMSFRLFTPRLQLLLNSFSIPTGGEFLYPVAGFGIVLCLLMGKESAFTFATLTSIILGFVWDRSFSIAVYCFGVTSTAILSLRNCKQRTDVYVSGAWSGLLGMILIWCFSLTDAVSFKTVDWSEVFITSALAFASGIISSIVASTLIPFFEWAFSYTTNLKLLELSNFNHPLLHNLMIKAPGTYHHSVIVGSLAELAADRIKANSLLARVSAYYHDIGKMNKPFYFIENQTPGNNPHDALQPSMSAKILFAHVKDGVRLGREHALGKSIVHIIEQHHGTTLVAFFFNKAKQTEGEENGHVHETEFHYPGPKPQSKEAAIVMLADSCEAATRSIQEPNPSKIQNMVHSIINKRFLEEQFSDCDLTLKDLKIIEECFVKTLISLHHHRIEYPGQKSSNQNINAMERRAVNK